jgi:hypothetical protein
MGSAQRLRCCVTQRLSRLAVVTRGRMADAGKRRARQGKGIAQAHYVVLAFFCSKKFLMMIRALSRIEVDRRSSAS